MNGARPLAPFVQRRGELPALGACRQCGRLTWHADDLGPVHDCCSRVPAGAPCIPCLTSLELHAKAEKMWQMRRRKGQ